MLLILLKMSIISRENPLNLQHQVCVVTSASSPLGVRICKTLLKANAFVLGIDSKKRDATLNAGLGTHFQFEERSLDGKDAAEKIVASAKEKFGVEKLNVLINLVEKGKESDLVGNEALVDATIVSMRQQGKGSVISVSEDVEAEHVPEPLVRRLPLSYMEQTRLISDRLSLRRSWRLSIRIWAFRLMSSFPKVRSLPN